jgi:antiphage defense system Thoeris ThsB-like protein
VRASSLLPGTLDELATAFPTIELRNDSTGVLTLTRRIFISASYTDQMQAKGFALLQWNRNVDFEFVGRHLLDPVNSTNEDYIKSKIREQLNGTSVTVVLIGDDTDRSGWVAWEVEESLSKSKPNGVLGILLPGHDAPPDPDSPVGKAIEAAGGEVIPWKPHMFGEAVERTAAAAGRIQAIRNQPAGGASCART